MAETFEFNEIGDAADAIREDILANKASFPEHVRDRLVASTRTGSSPVDMGVNFTEAVFANPSGFNTRSQRIALAFAELAQMKGYHGGMQGRAAGISVALSRHSGLKAPEGRSWPAKEEDPDANSDWAPPSGSDSAEPESGNGED